MNRYLEERQIGNISFVSNNLVGPLQLHIAYV